MSTQKEPDSGGSWNLIPLTPKYLAKEHSQYVTAIETALSNDQIHNIALSGNFGVGKSSILREVAGRQKGRVVELSLSTLAPIEASKLDESVPNLATTPTNRIQQEIVKQLLYREDPGKTPASRFRRIERFQWWREFWSSGLLGLAITIIFLLRDWTAKLANTFSLLGDMGDFRHLVILGIATGMVLLVRWQLYGKLHIKQLSAGSATVSLNETSVSYFDQYLDEIVYFFEVSERNIVIFEDIDRFNDSHIFESLRALNTLLNASPQIKRPIRFIYAIKDSIFDRIGLAEEGRKLEPDVVRMEDPALAEAVRANRTKFFDLVIPVVPFITHRSARNLAVQLLGDIKNEVALELLDLAAQYVPDMRLLKNVRNEFIIFRDRIFSGDGEQLNLSETDLFAMMLYKSTHLTDFETIRIGKSKLDVLYEVSRKLVTANIKVFEGELRELRQRLTRIDGAATRSAHLGKRLQAHVQRTLQSVGWQSQNETYSFAGVDYPPADLKGAQFWTDLVSSEGNPVLQWRNRYSQTLSFPRDNLAAALGDPLDADSWNQSDRESLIEQIDEKTDDIKFLRGADLGDLVRRPEFLVKHDDADQPLEAIAQAILKSGLAYQLVRAGYINRNFTLYTSTFHGNRVGSAATNFIIHHVERNLMDEHFELAPNDVDAVVRELDKNALKEPALYNIAILDHLLTNDDEAADIMVRSLVGFGESQTRFMQAYLASGKQRLQFIERFTAVSSRVLVFLVSQAELDDTSRLELVNFALNSDSAQKQKVDSAVSEYLSEHYAEFTALTADATEYVRAERIGALFADANVTVPRLEPLTQQVRASFVSRNLYEITHENLVIAVDNTETVALDVIRTANKTVYDYVLKHLSTYLGTITGESTTIDANKDFISVIEDVLEHEATLLGEVVERAARDCEVADLGDVSEGAWPALAEHGRFPATFSNVSSYVMSLKSIDEYLAMVLTAAGTITEVNGAEEESKVTLAAAILAAKNLLPSALRAELVASLSLRDYLDVDDVEAEAGNLFALLLKHNIIADSAVAYDHLAETDWPTRKAFICVSKKFGSYMTPDLLRGDLVALLRSDEISSEIKRVIVDQAEAYAEVADAMGLTELAQFATRNEHELAADVVQKMAQTGVETQQVVMLLEPHLMSISRDQLFAILQKLDGDYPKLTEVGHDKPKIPNSHPNLALLQRLRRENIVSKYDENESPIKVHKRYTEQ